MSVCFRMFAAAVIWNSKAGKEIVFNFPQPGRAAQFLALNTLVSQGALLRLLKDSF